MPVRTVDDRRVAPESPLQPDAPRESPVRLARGLQTPQQRSDRIKLRRALTFLGMTLVLPGSAQVAAGHRALGRVALRIWAGLWALVAVSALFAVLWPSGALAVFTLGPVLRVVQVGLILLGLGWALLLLDAWRIARPPELARRHRLGFAVLSLVLVGAVIGGLIASASIVSAQRDLVGSVFAGGGDRHAKAGRYNVLLLGGDAGKDRIGLRPDSMTIASVDADTGRTVLIGLPRNLEHVPFPDWSPLHKVFPKGFVCANDACLLNAVYTYAMGHKDLYPGVANPGAQATLEAIEGATGLEINYWALIDLKGFSSLIDAMGGITMDVYRRVPIGGGHAPIYGYVEAGKDRHLTGREALWFARSRSDSSDYDRMVRQKCVLNAMVKQLDPVTVLTQFDQLAKASKEIVATDIPAADIPTMLKLALAAKKLPMSSLNFVPPLVDPARPDFASIRNQVAARIATSEALDQPKPSTAPTAAASTKAPKNTGTTSRAPESDNLTSVCSV